MLIAAVVITPISGWELGPAFADPVTLLAGVGVGISSSVIPYISDQLAMARLPRATYATMVALLPALATIIGIIVLAQIPTWIEVAGVTLVIGGVALHQPATARAGHSAGVTRKLSSIAVTRPRTAELDRGPK
jgi:inner membrane transporter RhtA